MTRPSSPFVNLSALSQSESRLTKSPPPCGPRARPLPGGPRKPLSKLSMSSIFDDEDPTPSYYQEHVPRKQSEPILMGLRQPSMNNLDETPGECSSSVRRSATFQPGGRRPRGSSHAGILERSSSVVTSTVQHPPINVDRNTTAHQRRPSTPLPVLPRSPILPRYSSLNIAQPTPLRPVTGPISPTLDSPNILSYYGLESDPYSNGMEMRAPEYIRPLPPMPTAPSANTSDNMRLSPTRSSSPFPNLTHMAATVVESVVPQLALDVHSPETFQPQTFTSEKAILPNNDGTTLQQSISSTSSLTHSQTLHNLSASHSSSESAKAETMVRSLNKPVLSISQPPSIKFDPVSIAWRGLTLEAAQWSLSSQGLQAIVSRAIRKSSEESSIRLVPLDTLDNEVANEKERLDHMRTATQTKYRFLMQRRTMLLQSLAATVSNGHSDSETMGDLVRGLSELTIQGDRLVEELHQILDQQAQITHLSDVHAASALSVALRKLNASYAKRGEEISGLNSKLESVDMEREEAWRIAEEIAKELDDKDDSDQETDDDGTDDDDDDDISDYEVEVKNITGHAVATEAKLERTSRIVYKIPGVGPRTRTRQRSDSVSSRVSAARTRSQRASKASLRIPRDVQLKQKGLLPPTPLQQLPKHPPLPQIRFPDSKRATPPPPPIHTIKGSSFLDLMDRPISRFDVDVEQDIKKLREQANEAAPLSDDEHLRPVSVFPVPQPLTMVVPLRLDTKLQRREANSRVQSMLSPDTALTFGQLSSSSSNSPTPSMTLSIMTTSVAQLSDKDTSPRRNRPSSMPISAITPQTEDKPYNYF